MCNITWPHKYVQIICHFECTSCYPCFRECYANTCGDLLKSFSTMQLRDTVHIGMVHWSQIVKYICRVQKCRKINKGFEVGFVSIWVQRRCFVRAASHAFGGSCLLFVLSTKMVPFSNKNSFGLMNLLRFPPPSFPFP